MFILDGKPFALDTPFTHDGVQYPANWLRLASAEEREAIGIEEAPDPESYDQRFYWGSSSPMDHAVLVARWAAQTRRTAGLLLAPTDWQVIRELDDGTAMDAAIKAWRQDIRSACEAKIAEIEATVDTDQLAAYIAGGDYSVWPLDPSQPVPAPADGV